MLLAGGLCTRRLDGKNVARANLLVVAALLCFVAVCSASHVADVKVDLYVENLATANVSIPAPAKPTNKTCQALYDDIRYARARTVATTFPLVLPDHSSDIFAFTLGGTGMCVAFTFPNTTRWLTLTVEELRNFILEADCSTRPLLCGKRVILADLSTFTWLALAQLDISYSALRSQELPHIQWRSIYDLEGSYVIPPEERANSIILTSAVKAAGMGAPCAFVMTEHPRYPVVRLPSIPRLSNNNVIVANEENWTLTRIDNLVHYTERDLPIYPLVAPMYIYVKLDFCTASHLEPAQLDALISMATIARFLLRETTHAEFLRAGVAFVSPFQRLRAAQQLLLRYCSGMHSGLVFESEGSSVVRNLLGTAALEHFTRQSGILHVHSGCGSRWGVERVERHEQLSAFTEIVPDSAIGPAATTRIVPLRVFGIAIIANLPGSAGHRVILDKCTLLRVFMGDVTHWDDPSITSTNPMLALPHVRIILHIRDRGSGSNHIISRGLQFIGQQCAIPTLFDGSDSWPEPYVKENVQVLNGTVDLHLCVNRMPFSIGFAAHVSEAMATAISIDIMDGPHLSLSASREAVLALGAATLNSETGVISFPQTRFAYPFLGTTYLLLRRQYAAEDNCTRVRNMLRFVDELLRSEPRASDSHLLPLPPELSLGDALEGIMCDGEVLQLRPAEPATPSSGSRSGLGLSVSAIVVICAVCAIFLVLFTIAVYKLVFLLRRMRNNNNAPIDPANVTIVHMDIEGSALLWTRLGTEMNCAFETYIAVIRQAIVDHGAYEIKAVGERAQVACSTPDIALRVAVQVQQKLEAVQWGPLGPRIAAAYDALALQSSLSGHDTAGTSHTPRKLPRVSGLRVRIGIATGPCTIIADPVGGGLDYLGEAPGKASRIHHLAHGGQTLAAHEVTCRASGVISALGLRVRSHGHVKLKGFTGTHLVDEVVPPLAQQREFVSLRADSHPVADLSGTRAHSLTMFPAAPLLLGGPPRLQQSHSNNNSDSFIGAARVDLHSGHEPSALVESLMRPLAPRERVKVAKVLAHAWGIDTKELARSVNVRKAEDLENPELIAALTSAYLHRLAAAASAALEQRSDEDRGWGPQGAPHGQRDGHVIDGRHGIVESPRGGGNNELARSVPLAVVATESPFGIMGFADSEQRSYSMDGMVIAQPESQLPHSGSRQS